MTEEEKKHFDALSTMWNGAWQQFNQRRNYEWKVSLALWTACASFIALVFTRGISVDIQEWPLAARLVSMFLCLLVGVVHFYFLCRLHYACEADRDIARHYQLKMQSLSQSCFPKELEEKLEETRHTKCWRNWSVHSQAGITFTLLLLCLLAVLVAGRAQIAQSQARPLDSDSLHTAVTR